MPPRLTLQVASPAVLPSATFASVDQDHAPSPTKASRNSLFDQEWAPITPPSRSRSSTAESQFSSASSSAESGSRRSWMNVDSPKSSWAPPTRGPLVRNETVTLERTPVPGAKGESGFIWPTTPPSPAIRASDPFPTLPPLPPPVPLALQTPFVPAHPPPPPSAVPSAPRPPPNTAMTKGRSPSWSAYASLPGSGTVTDEAAAALPPSAGHSSNPLLDTRQSPSLRLSPSPLYLLGEGRHASVYLASFPKRLSPDRESQVTGLGEAFILAKLSGPTGTSREGGSRFILRLHGVKDERDGLEAPLPLAHFGSASVSRSGSEKRYSTRSDEGMPRSPLGRRDSGDDAAPERHRPASLQLPSSSSLKLKKGPRHSDILNNSSSTSSHKLSLLSHALEPPLSSSRRRVTLGGSQTMPGTPTLSSTGGTLDPSPLSPTTTPSPAPRIDLLVEYCPLGHALQFARAHPEHVDKARWFGWAVQLASAVEWAHERGVLHADIKPQNVMVASDLTLRLADWGTSLFLPPPSSPAHLFPTDPHGLGTPSYSPPEFVRPLPSPFSYPSDIFSLALTLHTLLTAREPYEGLRTMERMLHVAAGGWWEVEERRRLRDLEGDEAELVSLSRQGSVRSVASGRSGRSARRSVAGSLRGRRDDSVESVRSVVSNSPEAASGPRDWETLARSLLLDDADDAAEAAALVRPESSLPPLPSPPEGGAPSPIEPEYQPSTRYYAGTSTPVQHFLAADEDVPAQVVPLAVRDLLRRMASPSPEHRPTAAEVRRELERIASEEGVALSM
ncbi:hypothetical protein Rhopal_004440-T1 [Rhodotorula paludigena]|uniref:Protein kinase domain-containing protein n=1 Tax=Rhodotorula paludigena TaxID=86838 RepID=A0AAV5GLQ5_9BASI|nr:hypothetical protein Rhopal_004440-T1 [Rhodotorula paludigena]